MENPIDFDIWCKLEENATKAASVWTANIHSIAILDAFKVVRNSLNQDGYVQIFVGCGWDDIPRFQQKLPDFTQQGSCVVTESSYRPSTCTGYCEKHLLRHTSQVCPVCEGFYISHIIDGKRIVSRVNELPTR